MTFADARSRVATSDNRHITEPIGLYNVALDIEPDNEQALERLMHLYEHTGRRADWMTLAKQLLRINPMHTDAIRLKAIGYSGQGRFEEAEHYASRLIMLDPDDIAWRQLYVQILRDAGRPTEEIVDLCREWIDAYEEDGRYYMLKANVLASVGNRSAARKAAYAAVHRGASESNVLQQLLSLLDMLEMSREAEMLIVATQDKYRDEMWPYEAAIYRQWQRGNIGAALSILDEVEQRNSPLNTELLRWKSLLFILDGHYSEAELALDQLTDRAEAHIADRESIRAWIAAARARIGSGDEEWNETLRAYNSVLALDPNDPIIHYLMGEAYVQINEHELALRSFERALQSDPNWVTVNAVYIDTLMHTNRFDEAAHHAARLLARIEQPTLQFHLRFLRAWVNTNLRAEDLSLARRDSNAPASRVEYATGLHDRFPDHPEVNELLIRTLLIEGDRDSATEYVRRLLESKDTPASLYLTLASVSDQFQLGIEEQLIERAEALKGLTLEVAMTKATQLHRSGQTESGLSLLRQAGVEAIARAERAGADTSLVSEHVRRHIVQYRAWTNDPRAVQAIRSYLRTNSNPESATFALQFPLTWEHHDVADHAITILEESLGPHSTEAAIARATYILRHQRYDDAAMAHAMVQMHDVLHRTPHSARALSLMAALYLATDPPEYDIAIRYLRMAVEAEPMRGELYPQLIVLLQQHGDYARARKYLDRMGRIPGLNHELLRAQIELYEAQGDRDAIVAQLSGRFDHQQNEDRDLLLFSALHRTGRHADAEHVLRRLLDQPQPSFAVFAAATEFYGNLGRLREAQRLLESRLLDRKPGEAALLLGRLHAKHGILTEAERWLTLAVERQPNRAEAWLELAQFHLDQQDYEQARDTAANGLRSTPYHTGLSRLLAVITMHLTSAARAETVNLLDEHDYDCEALVATLELYDRMASRTDSPTPTSRDLLDLRHLIRDHPDYYQAWHLAITAHAEAGKLDRAHEMSREAVGRFPAYATPARLATHVLISKGRLDQAQEMAWIWRSRSLDMPLEADAVIAAIHLDLHQASEAASHLTPYIERILAHRERHHDLVPLVLRTLIESKRIDEAADLFGPFLHEDERLLDTWIEATRTITPSFAAHSFRRLDEALGNGVTPEFAEAQIAFARELIEFSRTTGNAGFIDSARHRLMTVLNANPDEAVARSARLMLASLFVDEGNYEAAEAHYRMILDGNPKDWDVLRRLAECVLHGNESLESAHALSARAYELHPDDIQVLQTHTRILLKFGKQDKAIEVLSEQSESLLRNRDRLPEGVELWIRTLALSNRWNQAEQVIAPLLDEDVRWAHFLLELSRDLPSSAAETAIERAAERLVQMPDGIIAVATEWASLGARTGDTGHMIKALQLADRAEAADIALSRHATLLRASIAERIGNDDAAAEQYRIALRMDPSNVFALNNLAALLLRTGGDIAEAIDLSERALKRANEYPELLNTYARALLHANRHDEAEPYARQALERESEHPAFLLTLSDIMLAKGEFDQARHWFSRAEAAMRDHGQHDPILRHTFADVRSRFVIDD